MAETIAHSMAKLMAMFIWILPTFLLNFRRWSITQLDGQRGCAFWWWVCLAASWLVADALGAGLTPLVAPPYWPCHCGKTQNSNKPKRWFWYYRRHCGQTWVQTHQNPNERDRQHSVPTREVKARKGLCSQEKEWKRCVKHFQLKKTTIRYRKNDNTKVRFALHIWTKFRR